VGIEPCGKGSAYDLYLTRELRHAVIARSPTSPTVVDVYVAQKLDVAAGVKQQLQADQAKLMAMPVFKRGKYDGNVTFTFTVDIINDTDKPAKFYLTDVDAGEAHTVAAGAATGFGRYSVDADWVVGDTSMWVFAGSGFRDGEKVPHMVGNEYDRVNASVPTPGNIQVLAHSPVSCRGMKSFADTTWYSAPCSRSWVRTLVASSTVTPVKFAIRR